MQNPLIPLVTFYPIHKKLSAGHFFHKVWFFQGNYILPSESQMAKSHRILFNIRYLSAINARLPVPTSKEDSEFLYTKFNTQFHSMPLGIVGNFSDGNVTWINMYTKIPISYNAWFSHG